MVEREAVRLGVEFQVGGKWCSFVAVEKNKQNKEKNAENWEYLEDESPAVVNRKSCNISSNDSDTSDDDSDDGAGAHRFLKGPGSDSTGDEVGKRDEEEEDGGMCNIPTLATYFSVPSLLSPSF